MDNILTLRCPLLTPMTLSIPFVVGDDCDKYTHDERSIHMLKAGLLAVVSWNYNKKGGISVKRLSPETVLYDRCMCIGRFGFGNGEYVWVSPQAVHELGVDAALADLPRALGKLMGER